MTQPTTDHPDIKIELYHRNHIIYVLSLNRADNYWITSPLGLLRTAGDTFYGRNPYEMALHLRNRIDAELAEEEPWKASDASL